MLRKLIILSLTVVGSIVVWEASDLSDLLSSADRNKPDVHRTTNPRDNLLPEQRDESRLTGQRLLALALFIILAPVITAPLANWVIDRQSNTANLLLLFGYTGLDIVAAHMIGAISIGGILSAIGYLIALLAVFSYNLWICAYLASLHKK